MPSRILIVTGIFPPDIGGPASFVSELAGFLAHQGHHVTVLTLSDGRQEETRFPYRVVRLSRATFLPLRLLHVALSVRILARSHDFLFCNALYFETFLGWPKNKLSVCKVVSDQVYDRFLLKNPNSPLTPATFQEQSVGIFNRLDRHLRAWALRRCGLIVTPSNYFANIIRRFGKKLPEPRVIPNAYKPQSIETVTRDPKCLIMVCRLIPAKNVDIALRALPELPEYHLEIVGDGPDRARLQTLAAELGVGNRVTFLNRLQHDEAVTAIARAGAFLLLSRYENFPHTVLEAQAAGTPVIASAVGGVPEMVRHAENGILLQELTPESVALAVRGLTPNSADKIVAQARQSVENYLPEKIFGIYEGLFHA